MDAVTLSSIYSHTGAAYNEAKDAKSFITLMTVLHLRHEHNMPIHKIAKRCDIKANKVKLILHNYAHNSSIT
jgi:hypothetical protein